MVSCNYQQKSSTMLSPKAIAHRVGETYGDGNAQVLKAVKTITVGHKPMYCMIIKGKFTKDSKTAKYLRFSATADKFHYWVLEASKSKKFNHIVWKNF